MNSCETVLLFLLCCLFSVGRCLSYTESDWIQEGCLFFSQTNICSVVSALENIEMMLDSRVLQIFKTSSTEYPTILFESFSFFITLKTKYFCAIESDCFNKSSNSCLFTPLSPPTLNPFVPNRQTKSYVFCGIDVYVTHEQSLSASSLISTASYSPVYPSHLSHSRREHGPEPTSKIDSTLKPRNTEKRTGGCPPYPLSVESL